MPLVDGCRLSIALDTPIDDRINAIAGCQAGCAHRTQLIAAGVSTSAIQRRLVRGRLELVHTCVYALPNTAELPFAIECAAVLVSGDAAHLSHHSAATLWELRPGRARPVHITIPAGRSGPTLSAVIIHRTRILSPADRRYHRGLPVTSPARTLLDVAATLPDRDLERLLDEALFVRRLVTRAEINELLARAGGHPGRARLARVAGGHEHPGHTESPPAECLLGMIRAAGLPEPRLEMPMLDYRLDLHWPELRLAVEIDAYGTHGSPARFEADRRRDARLLTEMGISVVRVTRLAITHRPFEVIASLARAISQRQRPG